MFWLLADSNFLPKRGLKLEDNFATSRADVGMEVKIVPRFYQMITERICSRPLSIFTGMDAVMVKIRNSL